MLLRIENLTIEAATEEGVKTLVEGIDLRVSSGEVVGLIGESGAGKSTIGLAAIGYVRPNCKVVGGRVSIDGEDLFALPRTGIRRLRRQRTAYVAQSAAASFNPSLRIGDQVAEVLRTQGEMSREEIRKRSEYFFRRLLLPEPERFGERYPHQVSGGQLQRAMTAMAFTSRPDVLVLDEPTTALDVTSQQEFLNLVQSLIEETGLAVLYVTHDLALVSQLSSRIVVLKNGKVVEEGPTRALISKPTSAYTLALLNARHVRAEDHPEPDLSGRPLLDIHQLAAGYGQKTVLHDVTLKIFSGTTTAIVGESGSGKSTLSRVICGTLGHYEGTLIYGPKEIGVVSTRKRDVLREIQLVHQNPDMALNPRMTVFSVLERPLKVFFKLTAAQRRARINDLLDLVGLPREAGQRRPAELSGGQKQRVCIARALAAEPRILVCDEITASLDALIAKDVLMLLMRLKSEHDLTCIFITHDFSAVKALADQVVVMLNGRIVEEGPCAAMMNAPKTAYTRKLLSAVPTIARRPSVVETPLAG